MSLSTSANLVKYLLFLFNFFFVITGITIMAIGLTVQGAYHNFAEILDPQFFSVPTFLVVIGCFIFIIAFFGCCGAYKENYCMTLTFSVLLVLIFILELAAGISGYVLRNDTYNLVSTTLRSSMEHYGGNTSQEITYIWDEIQVDFDCCGVDKSDDWVKSNDQLFNSTFLPITCCKTSVGSIGVVHCPDEQHPERLRKTGCIKSFGNYIRSHAVSLGAAGIAIAVIQFFGIFFACYLSKQIKMQHGHTGF
ncbi:CD63 antigen-like [Topomyia yanbarensis]|uniref:CD63 antigen-like n=1 Tax=Topomyia yanbarensis TaxID=2498891 RepID=UPI00273A8DFD|nr:CD63 antigen-like [Topomyia yanbarensis]XP_058814313.1 CD63 antigen-like [Topomyia yanbarensis]XP_058814314.1 CD63 antigen-like [Topomyia yanbarensis]XP_058814315.1 CD63 antigen-like [Topomyia yanbarensis]XP_058814316.1 CD63 antigen-like [Topomyia yanbarensis]